MKQRFESHFYLVKGDDARRLAKYANLSVTNAMPELREMYQNLNPNQCAELLFMTYGDRSFTVSNLGDGGFDAWSLLEKKRNYILYIEIWTYSYNPRTYIFSNDVRVLKTFLCWMNVRTSNVRYTVSQRN